MDTKDMMPFAFTDGHSPKDKSQNIIKVIGVGGGGSNAVVNMCQEGVHNVRFAICNTDSQSLAQADVPIKIQLGDAGLGVGGKPEKGKEAALASIEAINTLFEDNTEMVFITAGMGGGTGTGAAAGLENMKNFPVWECIDVSIKAAENKSYSGFSANRVVLVFKNKEGDQCYSYLEDDERNPIKLHLNYIRSGFSLQRIFTEEFQKDIKEQIIYAGINETEILAGRYCR